MVDAMKKTCITSLGSDGFDGACYVPDGFGKGVGGKMCEQFVCMHVDMYACQCEIREMLHFVTN